MNAELFSQRQFRIFSANEASKILESYSSEEIRKKCKTRHVKTSQELFKHIEKEIFIKEYVSMNLWPLKDIEALARRLGMKWSGEQCDAPHLSWLVCLVLVRDNIPFQVENRGCERRIIVDNK